MEFSAAEVFARMQEGTAQRRAKSRPVLLEMLPRIRAAVQDFRQLFEIEQVWLFGSYARGEPSVTSDVDLAVGGLKKAEHFRAMAHLTRVLGRPVEVVRLEDLTAHGRERVLGESMKL